MQYDWCNIVFSHDYKYLLSLSDHSNVRWWVFVTVLVYSCPDYYKYLLSLSDHSNVRWWVFVTVLVYSCPDYYNYSVSLSDHSSLLTTRLSVVGLQTSACDQPTTPHCHLQRQQSSWRNQRAKLSQTNDNHQSCNLIYKQLITRNEENWRFWNVFAVICMNKNIAMQN